MKRKLILSAIAAALFCQVATAEEKHDNEAEYSCEKQDGRDYCVDSAGVPLSGKIYKTWPKSGEYKSIINYKKGFADGLATYFNKNGKLMERVYYKFGVKNGMDKIYYDNRTIKVSANYKNGRLDGWQNLYTPEGKRQGKIYYKNGKITSGFCVSYGDKRRIKKALSAEQMAQNGDNQMFFCKETGDKTEVTTK